MSGYWKGLDGRQLLTDDDDDDENVVINAEVILLLEPLSCLTDFLELHFIIKYFFPFCFQISDASSGPSTNHRSDCWPLGSRP